MHFSIFAKMRKSCEKGRFSRNFVSREYSFSKTKNPLNWTVIRHAWYMWCNCCAITSHFRRKIKTCEVMLEFSCHWGRNEHFIFALKYVVKITDFAFSRKFPLFSYIFVKKFSRKRKSTFAKTKINFRENANTKIFVSTLQIIKLFSLKYCKQLCQTPDEILRRYHPENSDIEKNRSQIFILKVTKKILVTRVHYEMLGSSQANQRMTFSCRVYCLSRLFIKKRKF
jgi:hypothetical protein